MTPTDTRAALDAAILEIEHAASDLDPSAPVTPAWRRVQRALDAIAPAIAAHVEAEVARRLAAAPEVEVEIDSLRPYLTGGATLDYLLAAIAADKARAVEAARPTPDEARRLVEAHRLDLLSIADTVAALHGSIGPGLRGHCVSAADKLRAAAGASGTALLRALGVEA